MGGRRESNGRSTGGVSTTPPLPKPFAARRFQAKREVRRLVLRREEWGKIPIAVEDSDANVHTQHADALGGAVGGDDMQQGING